jgi:acetyltransferase-like isoleucine patch superfamily enzyme
MSVLLALTRGRVFLLRCLLIGKRVVGGTGLRLYGRLHVKGPGTLVLGEDIVVEMTVTAWTHDPDARISIGTHSFLNGTRFGCASEITIGDYAILGESHIFDTDFHSLSADRWNPTAPVRRRPVRLGRNVWVGANAGLLPGTVIDDNSVVGFGAVCAGRYPRDSVIVGNPARVLRSIPESGETA